MPAAAIAGPAIAGYLANRGQASSQGQTAAGGALSKNASTLSGMATPQLQQAGGYFSSLAGGNRAQMTQTLAPDIENVKAIYGGTAQTLSRFLRGPQKDVQMAESEREKAGQIGSLFRNLRPQANTALAGMGSTAMGQATAAAGGAGSIFGQQTGQALQGGIAGAQFGMEAGQGFGNLLFNLLKSYGAKGGGGGGGFAGLAAPTPGPF